MTICDVGQNDDFWGQDAFTHPLILAIEKIALGISDQGC